MTRHDRLSFELAQLLREQLVRDRRERAVQFAVALLLDAYGKWNIN